MKTKEIIVDSDVLIWCLRGNEKAHILIDQYTSGFHISVVTYIELVQGMKNKRELGILRSFLKKRNVEVLQITPNISINAMFYVEEHFLSHSLMLADALIAATCIDYGFPLLTGNEKHYKIIRNIEIKKFSPEQT